ncbi:MAG: PDZ domain-containing protein [Verrucomicrobia bacterium]|nr:PDZ domain-containing protein [Verrucomicrobiota bacterium]
MNADRITIILGAILLTPLIAQQNLETDFRMTGRTTLAAFEAQRQVLQQSSAVISIGQEEIAYGVVVSANGHVLTKASELREKEKLTITIDRQRFDKVEVISTDDEWDVALLKVDATNLVPVTYTSATEIPQGTWVVVNGATSRTQRRANIGMISAKPREIQPSGGLALGIVIKNSSKRIELEKVTPEGGAHEAGLKAGDVIVAIDDKPLAKIEELSNALDQYKAGDKVRITFKRDGKTSTVDVRLTAKTELFDISANRNDEMSGDFSKRRSGFPRVIQHSVMGNSQTMGGPVIDLNSHCLGMNIARASRAETFAIPSAELKQLAARMIDHQPSR